MGPLTRTEFQDDEEFTMKNFGKTTYVSGHKEFPDVSIFSLAVGPKNPDLLSGFRQGMAEDAIKAPRHPVADGQPVCGILGRVS